MYNLLPQLIIILSLAGLIIIFAKRFSAAKKESEEEIKENTSFFEIPRIRMGFFVFQKRALEITEKSSRKFSVFMLKMANLGSFLAQGVKKKSQKLHFVPELSLNYFKKLKRRRPEIELSPIEKECIKLIKKDPSNTDAYRKLGDYYLEEGNLKDARLTFQQILKLSPEDENAKEKLREIRRTTG